MNENKLILEKIRKSNDIVTYEYKVYGEIKKYFHEDKKFFVQYYENIEEIPDSILIVPFLCNILPIAWMTDTEIIVNEIDSNFYDSIEKFKKGYIDMYPKISFLGKITYKELVNNNYNEYEQNATFFSGGVDATSTLVTHINEKMFTITLWGADVRIDNENGWKIVKEFIEQNTNEMENKFIKSSFREFLNEYELTILVRKYVNEGWWHGFQHGIGLIGHAAPLAYKYKVKTIYIPSSYTIREKGIVTCASDPTIDNFVKFASCEIFHDGYEYNRQDKIRNICNYKVKNNANIQLRVCWQSDTGSNCNKCEKCLRTIMAIKAEGENPEEYGFKVDYSKIKTFLTKHWFFDFVSYPYWKDIKDRFIENKEMLVNCNEIQWIYDLDMDKANRRYNRIDQKLKRLIKRIINKIIRIIKGI